MLPDLSRLAVCATGTSVQVKPEEAAQNIVATIKMVVEQANRAWRPPSATISAPDFPPSSVPVYVAVHALKHRTTMQLDVPKLTSVQPTYENGEVNIGLDLMNDERLVAMMDDQLGPEEGVRFWFQAVFNLAGNYASKKVDTMLWCLHFTPGQIKDVRDRARRFAAKGNAPKEMHLVLTVVSDDSEYEDLSLHSSAPSALETNPPKPNTMALPLDAFVADAPTQFIAPRGF
jgi:hypothetical protein